MSHAYCMKAYLSQWQRLHSASAPPVYMSESQRSYGQCMQTGTAQQQVLSEKFHAVAGKLQIC